MEDSKPIIPNGTASPYLAIFDIQGKSIKDPKSNLPIGMLVTNFTYEYNEEKSDTFEISIECNNPDLIDLPSLGNQMPLQLQWGWIYPDGSSNSGPVRKVVIRDTELSLKESGVRLIIKGTDAFDLTKNTPSDLEDKTFVQWVKNNISGKYTIEIIDYSSKNQFNSQKGS